jgi:hypothetical protein
LGAHTDQALQRARAFCLLPDVELEPSQFERCIAARCRGRNRRQQLFSVGVTTVIDVDTRAQGDGARIGGRAEKRGDAVVLPRIQRFARGVETGLGGSRTNLRADQRRDDNEQPQRDEKFLHDAALSIAEGFLLDGDPFSHQHRKHNQ